MLMILSREGADPKVLGHFFKAVVQAVFFFGTETWVLTPRMERALRIFQNRVARRLTRRQRRLRGKGSWEYPPLEVAMEEVGFDEIRVYVTRRQNTVVQYIVTRKIMDLYEKSVSEAGSVGVSEVVGARRPGSRGGKGESDGGVSIRGGARRGESGTERDAVPGLRAGSTKVAT